ncbi:MAG: patatin-like phospholipase family protein [Myxococcota bacterium]
MTAPAQGPRARAGQPSPGSGGTLGAWLDEAPFTLSLSSGFFGFFAHAGVLAALEDAGLRPRAFLGASAGALVGALAAGGYSGTELGALLASLRREEFWDPAPGPGLLRGRRFRRRLEAALPRATFEACARPLRLSVYELRARKTRVRSRGALASAVQASCAVPGLFWPVRLDGRLHLDGGIRDRPGLAGARPGERILHHHLESRSRRGQEAAPPPRRENLELLAFPALPRVGPFRLEEGPRAFAAAHRYATRALDAPRRSARRP